MPYSHLIRISLKVKGILFSATCKGNHVPIQHTLFCAAPTKSSYWIKRNADTSLATPTLELSTTHAPPTTKFPTLNFGLQKTRAKNIAEKGVEQNSSQLFRLLSPQISVFDYFFLSLKSPIQILKSSSSSSVFTSNRIISPNFNHGSSLPRYQHQCCQWDFYQRHYSTTFLLRVCQ